MTSRLLQALVLALGLFTGAAHGTQHLIRPGDDWSGLASRLGPGDEVILMPGRHQPARLDSIQGSAEFPIVIRGLDPDDPSIIEAGRYGLRLTNARHVVVEQLIIDGASVHGLAVEAATPGSPPPTDSAAPATPRSGHVTIRHVAIFNTGPRGQRHALLLRHVDRIAIVHCQIEGWAGSAIDIVGCRHVDIEDTTFAGRERFAQISGIRIRAGSQQVEISRCRFVNFGEQGISIGAGSSLDDFVVLPSGDRLYEATDVRVHRTVFDGGQCAISFVNCHRADVRYCTIANPGRAVVSVRREQQDPRFGPPTECAFDANLITWDNPKLNGLTHLGPGATPAGIAVGENVWWGPNALEDFPGEVVFPQITELDPGLDATLQPTAEAATLFGAGVP